MNVNLSIATDGKVKISMGSEKVRKDNLSKWMARNDDAILVKLNGYNDWPNCKPGHICRIEEDDGTYNVFVGPHYIGQLPDEAIVFANQIDSSPEFMVSIVGKTEDNNVFIYIAE